MGNDSLCDSLLVAPTDASQYFTTLQCGQSINYDLDEDGDIDNADLILLVISVILVIGNLLADIVLAISDPRIKHELI